MLNKHKLFLLCAKWIPIVTAIGILVTNTIAYYGCNDIVVDIFNFNIGTSVAGVILMYVCSYAFNFCIWHKLVITYNALIIAAKKNIFIDGKDKLFIRCSKESITKCYF